MCTLLLSLISTTTAVQVPFYNTFVSQVPRFNIQPLIMLQLPHRHHYHTDVILKPSTTYQKTTISISNSHPKNFLPLVNMTNADFRQTNSFVHTGTTVLQNMTVIQSHDHYFHTLMHRDNKLLHITAVTMDICRQIIMYHLNYTSIPKWYDKIDNMFCNQSNYDSWQPLLLWLHQLAHNNGTLMVLYQHCIIAMTYGMSFKHAYQPSHSDVKGYMYSCVVILSTQFIGFIKKWTHTLCRYRPPDTQVLDITEEALNIKARRLIKLASLLSLAATTDFIMTGSQHALHNSIQAFTAPSGILDTTSLPPKQRQDLLSQLTTLPRGLLSSTQTIDAIVDTGASNISSPDLDDFVAGTYKAYSIPRRMNGIAEGLDILGEGITNYEVIGHGGHVKQIRMKQLYVPQLPVRLIPPQAIFPTENDGYFRISGETASFLFNDGTNVPCEILPSCNLPLLRLFHDASLAAEHTASAFYTCVTDEANQNLTRTQKALLLMHFRLGHASMQFVQWLGRRGLLGESGKCLGAVSEAPLCGTCQYAKQKRTNSKAKTTKDKPSSQGNLSKEALQPGDCVATDQFEVTKRGRLQHTRGREPQREQYTGVPSLSTWQQVKQMFTIRCLYVLPTLFEARPNMSVRPKTAVSLSNRIAPTMVCTPPLRFYTKSRNKISGSLLVVLTHSSKMAVLNEQLGSRLVAPVPCCYMQCFAGQT